MKQISRVFPVFLIILAVACSSESIEDVIKNGDLNEVVKRLEDISNTDEKDEKGHTMLYYAVIYNQLEIFETLLKYGASYKPSPGSKDLRLIAAERAHEEILEYCMLEYDVFFDDWEEEDAFVKQLVSYKLLDILKLYFEAFEDSRVKMSTTYDIALEQGSEEIINYLEGELLQYWPVFDPGMDPVDPDPGCESVFGSAFLYLQDNESELGMEPVYEEYPQSGYFVIRIWDPYEAFAQVLDQLLSQPRANDDGWRSGLKNSYFHHVVSVLPARLPSFTRHDGYHTKANASLRDQYIAYFLHRVDRDPVVIQRLWNMWQNVVLERISVRKYVELDFHSSVEALLYNWEYIGNHFGYQDTLKQCYDDLEKMHWDESNKDGVYGWDWYSRIPDCLYIDNPWGVSQSWTASFWVRRYHEGNHEVVERILREIKSYYGEDERLKEWIREKGIIEIEEY